MAIWGEKVYVPAIMGASGITKEQAKTCLYYAVTTYLVPEKLKRMPLLEIIGPPGTGKSDLLTQLSRLVNEPKIIAAKTTPTLRDKLINTTTAIIDEGTIIDEDLLIRRYANKTSKLSYKKNLGGSFWHTKNINIFGATIIVRRIPFSDSALTSRSIIINTRRNVGKYRIKRLRKASENLVNVAEKIKLKVKTSERILDNWMPLRAIAEYLGDNEWLEYSDKEISKGRKSLEGSQIYDPEPAILMALRENMIRMTKDETVIIDIDVPLSTIRNDLKTEFDLHLKNLQIQDACQSLGFKIVSHSGYPKVKSNVKRLKRLLKEHNI